MSLAALLLTIIYCCSAARPSDIGPTLSTLRAGETTEPAKPRHLLLHATSSDASANPAPSAVNALRPLSLLETSSSKSVGDDALPAVPFDAAVALGKSDDVILPLGAPPDAPSKNEADDLQAAIAAAAHDFVIASREEHVIAHLGDHYKNAAAAGTWHDWAEAARELLKTWQKQLQANPLAGSYTAGGLLLYSLVLVSVVLMYANRIARRKLQQESLEPTVESLFTVPCLKQDQVNPPVASAQKIETPRLLPEPPGFSAEAPPEDENDEDSLDQMCASIPASFKCPITKEIMTDPVSTVDGLTYECESIMAWFRLGNRTSPLTNAELPSLLLTKNIALRNAIAEFRRLRPVT